MSDDEYYDEFDDIFWIEEPEPDEAVSFILFARVQLTAQAGANHGVWIFRTT